MIKSINYIKTSQSVDERMHKCPFYGLFMFDSLLIDQQGNQCPLIEGSYSPCQMEYNGKSPSWEDCCFNNLANEKGIEKIASSFYVSTERAPDYLTPLRKQVITNITNFVRSIFGRNKIKPRIPFKV